ncbi:MAG: hypothetical protein SGBAC_004930 [Bacillariaceae sp.]
MQDDKGTTNNVSRGQEDSQDGEEIGDTVPPKDDSKQQQQLSQTESLKAEKLRLAPGSADPESSVGNVTATPITTTTRLSIQSSSKDSADKRQLSSMIASERLRLAPGSVRMNGSSMEPTETKPDLAVASSDSLQVAQPGFTVGARKKKGAEPDIQVAPQASVPNQFHQRGAVRIGSSMDHSGEISITDDIEVGDSTLIEAEVVNDVEIMQEELQRLRGSLEEMREEQRRNQERNQEQQQQQQQQQSEIPKVVVVAVEETRRNCNTKLWIVLAVLVIIAAGTAGVFLSGVTNDKAEESSTSTTEAAGAAAGATIATESPTSTLIQESSPVPNTTETPSPTKVPIPAPTMAPVAPPTTPTITTKAPTRVPTASPIQTVVIPPTRAPIPAPTLAPTLPPTLGPTPTPPTLAPTSLPSTSRTNPPTPGPTPLPTTAPTSLPTPVPITLPPTTASPTQETLDTILAEYEPLDAQALLWLQTSTWQPLEGDPNANYYLLERYALASLYFSTTTTTDGTSSWQESENWLSGQPVCDWFSKQQDGNNENCEGPLTNLNLAGNGLQGSIPAVLFGLTSLTLLDLSNNQLTGRIPESIGNLGTGALKELRLQSNQLSGSIPASISSLRSLEWLYLQDNRLAGSVPVLPFIDFDCYLDENCFQDFSNAADGNCRVLNNCL